jgi:hypothetical protein
MFVNIKVTEESREKLKKIRDCRGFADYNQFFSTISEEFSMKDLQEGLSYIRNRGKSAAGSKRVNKILTEIDKLLNNPLMIALREDLLKMKIVCEEYLK